MLQISKYSKKYNQKTILEISHKELETGIYWIKGKNGSGKSTLFKSIAGIIPFEGDINCDGFSVKKHPVAYRLKVNYASSEPAYPDFLTLHDLISFVAKSKGGTTEQIQELLDSFEMTQFERQAVGTFSSGMLKKTSIILAFLGSPSWIILDEPFSTLDIDSSGTLPLIIEKMKAQNTGFLISSHIEEESNIAFNETFLIKDGGFSSPK